MLESAAMLFCQSPFLFLWAGKPQKMAHAKSIVAIYCFLYLIIMIFIFGTRQVARDVKDSLPRRQFCPKCSLLADMKLQRVSLYFSAFFIPIIPISKSKEVLRCTRCHGMFYAGTNMAAPEPQHEERAVIICPECGGKCGIPAAIKNAIVVTCLRCRFQFEVSMRPWTPS
jgi:hypothetical protein